MTIAILDTTRPLPVPKRGASRDRNRRQVSQTDRRDVAHQIAVVAHDVRGPLASLLLTLEAIETKAGPEAKREIADEIDRAMMIIERVETMLAACIERSRRLGDPLAIEPWPVSVVDLVEQVAALNAPLAKARGVRLHVYSADPLVVEGDGHLLMQAIDNLVSNALKHAPEGSLVTVQAMQEDRHVSIRVDDDGPGFAAGDIAKAFRPFTRLSTRSHAPLHSTGLGLSIVKSIVTRHGGTVAIARGPRNAGASVTITLPRP